MAHPIVMPKAGQSMTEGKVVQWLKREGEAVTRGEPILEVETDKATVEVEAQESGVLRKVLVPQGETCPVFTLIAVLGSPDEVLDLEALKKAALPAAPEGDGSGATSGSTVTQTGATPLGASATATTTAPPPASQSRAAPSSSPLPRPEAGPSHSRPAPTPRETAAQGGRVFASPLARRLAGDRGVDIARVRGSGPGGRILRRDVESAPSGGTSRPAASAVAWAPTVKERPYPAPSPRPPERVVLEGMRKAIASALRDSKQSIPHFYATISVDMQAALALKASLDEDGVKVSVNDIIIRASAVALRDEPRMNCRVFPDRIEYPSQVNIGIAVGNDEGLVVPVVLGAESRDLADTAAECRRIIAAAQGKKLVGSGQGTFTVSNLGMFGIESFTAIINPPEGAILAVGAVSPMIVPVAGGLISRPMAKLTLSSDHRAIDGILAAKFLSRLRHVLEHVEML